MSKSIKISGDFLSKYNEIISNEALQFVQEIHEKFNPRRLELLNERKKRQKAIDGGDKLNFPDGLILNLEIQERFIDYMEGMCNFVKVRRMIS